VEDFTGWSVLQGDILQVECIAKWKVLQSEGCCRVKCIAGWMVLQGGWCCRVDGIARWRVLQGGGYF
jgi:hypothetical protein